MTTRTRYTATYLYPGSFMPEEAHRDLPEPTFETAVEYGPDDEHGYFNKDGWYAVRIHTITEKRYDAGDGDFVWVKDGKPKVEKIIVGREVHVTAPEIAGDQFHILRSNIAGNSRDPYKNLAVRTRAGNWQIRSDYDRVVAP